MRTGLKLAATGSALTNLTKAGRTVYQELEGRFVYSIAPPPVRRVIGRLLGTASANDDSYQDEPLAVSPDEAVAPVRRKPIRWDLIG